MFGAATACSATGSNYIYVLFQLTFAAITAALISGAIADRVKLSSWIVFVPLWVTLCYFPIAHNVWGGGWLYSHALAARTTPVARSCTSTPVSRAVCWP